jgi:hypothetical protein
MARQNRRVIDTDTRPRWRTRAYSRRARGGLGGAREEPQAGTTVGRQVRGPLQNVFTQPGSTAAVAAMYPLSPVSVIQQNYLTITQDYCMLQKRKSGLPSGLV